MLREEEEESRMNTYWITKRCVKDADAAAFATTNMDHYAWIIRGPVDWTEKGKLHA